MIAAVTIGVTTEGILDETSDGTAVGMMTGEIRAATETGMIVGATRHWGRAGLLQEDLKRATPPARRSMCRQIHGLGAGPAPAGWRAVGGPFGNARVQAYWQ